VNILPVRPTHDFLFIDIVDREVTTKDLGNGKVLHLLPDDTFGPNRPHNPVTSPHPGVRPRWARVLAIGPEVHKGDVHLGDLVLCDTMKWSRGIPLGRVGLAVIYFWRINVKDVFLIDDRVTRQDYLDQFTEMLSHTEFTIGHL
jgi:hypothetical protein